MLKRLVNMVARLLPLVVVHKLDSVATRAGSLAQVDRATWLWLVVQQVFQPVLGSRLEQERPIQK